MVKYGIISDTHVMENDDPRKIKSLISQIKEIFKDVDEILHAGDVCDPFFFEEINNIARTKWVAGNMDTLENLEKFIKFTIGRYNIGLIHEPPENLEDFFKENELQILIHGHTHQPIIEGTPYNTLIINPGSPTMPRAPPQKKGFEKPVARPSVVILDINEENNMISTFIINLKIKK